VAIRITYLNFFCGVNNKHVNEIFFSTVHPVIEWLKISKNLWVNCRSRLDKNSQLPSWQIPNAVDRFSPEYAQPPPRRSCVAEWVFPASPIGRRFFDSVNLHSVHHDIQVCCNKTNPSNWASNLKFYLYFNSCAMAAICSTRSWWAARSLSKASCFLFRAYKEIISN
jgi:hypothetical protein